MLDCRNNVFRGKISAINGDEATIATNRSGELLSKITPAAVGKLKVGDDAMMFIRPEAFTIVDQKTETGTQIAANVQRSEFEGTSYNVYTEGNGGKEIRIAALFAYTDCGED